VRLALRRIRLPLGAFTLEVDAEITAGLAGLFGPSGAGKTTLLDLIAGLRRAPSAHIRLGDRVLTDMTDATDKTAAERLSVPTRERRIGYVPQDLALFPHLSVRRNLLYGAPAGTAPDGLVSFDQVTRLLDLGPLVDRGIAGLSGGEKQRVALARALLSGPELLLLDEPLSGLERPLRERILGTLRRIHEELRVPMLYVSHHADEVTALCEEVLLLERGRVVGQGPPAALLREARPAE
jgi:molybdate transport system ATP-binding protein